MNDEIKAIDKWYKEERNFAVATVIRTWGSAPRVPGSLMAISEDQEIIGSVSGGCVEGDVIRNSRKVIDSGEAVKLNYGVSNEDAWTVGLTCGGKIEVWVENKWDPSLWGNIISSQKSNTTLVYVSDGERKATLSDNNIAGDPLEDEVIKNARLSLESQKPQLTEQGYFINVFPSKQRLLIIGAAHISTHLVQIGSLMGFETIIIDPRGFFTDKQQFPTAPDKTFKNWPAEVLEDIELDQNTYVVLLTHDPKIDDQALHILLNSKVAYIGALGSKKTHEKRATRLKDSGFDSNQIERIHGPVGLEINARLPEEIAMSILSQIIKIRNE